MYYGNFVFFCFSVVPKAHVIVQEQPNGEYRRKGGMEGGWENIRKQHIFSIVIFFLFHHNHHLLLDIRFRVSTHYNTV